MSGRWSRAAEGYAAGLFLLYAVVLFAHAGPPSLTDYANWTYQGVLLRDHLLGVEDAAHALKHYPVPNSAATLGVGLLALVLPWVIAAKVWLCMQLALSFVVMRQVLRTTGARAAMWLVMPGAVFLNVNLWYGFVNFELGLCWVLLMAAILFGRVRKIEGSSLADLRVGGLLLIAFFTHMIPFACAGLLVVLYAVQTRRRRMLWQLLPAVMMSAWYVAGRYLLAGNADGQTGMMTTVREYSAAFWAYKVNSYLKSFGFINPGSLNGSVDVTEAGRFLFVVLFGVNALLCALLGWMMVRAARRAYRDRSATRFAWAITLLLLPLYLLAPGTALGVSDPGSRLLQVGLALGLVLCGREGGWRLRVAGGCAAVLAVAGLLLFARDGFGPERSASAGTPLPHGMVIFAHVPNHDQDYLYRALDRGEMRLPVFPTGMFLNSQQEPSR